MVALLGSVLNLGSFGAGWKSLAEDEEELGFSVRAVLTSSPGLCSKLVSPLSPPRECWVQRNLSPTLLVSSAHISGVEENACDFHFWCSHLHCGPK